ncbi:MAG: DUF4105 domain-containing protein [Spirochaetales bacterium]|nr:DUF4105 domain-containing protein [Spirochaetales bacterium]
MKRPLLMLMVLLLFAPLWALSIVPRDIEQPFDSVKELEAVDFSMPLAPNQRAWVDKTEVHLLTVGPGDPLYAWFGHSALIITQPSGTKVMYDWGIFDPEQKHFYLNFAQGRMYYYVVASAAEWRIEEALEEMRDVKLVKLDFSAESKFGLISFLQRHIKTEYSTYLYHFYYDNCATRIRDIINAATEGDFQAWAEEQMAEDSLRSVTIPAMIHSPLVFWVLDFLQGKTIDKPMNRYEELFLPEKLHQAVVDYSALYPHKLATSTEVLQEVDELGVRFAVEEGRSSFVWAYALVGLAIGALLLFLEKRFPRIRSVLLGLLMLALALLGALLLFMMLFSDMDMTYFNENILFVHPLLSIPAFGFLLQQKQRSRMVGISAVVMVVLVVMKLLIPSAALQDNLRTIALLLPIYLSGATFQRRSNIQKH